MSRPLNAVCSLGPRTLRAPFLGAIPVRRRRAIGGAGLFAVLAAVARRPGHIFRRIEAVTLVLAFVPDILPPGASSPFPGTTLVGVLALMLKHVTTWAVTVFLLTHFAVRVPTREPDGGEP